MIAKQIPMKLAKKSNFGELVNYIINAQNKHERVHQITVTNCYQTYYAHATDEILAIQLQNTRAESDKTYHLIISFQAGEQPAPEVLEAIESRLCDALGFKEHQRISAVHTDTDNMHIHVAINKIHPQRLTIHNPYCDHKTLGKACDKLELEYGLAHDNHDPKERGRQSRALDMEHAGGVESLLGWIRRECLDQIRAAPTWEGLHEVMQRNGLVLSAKGNGLVITDREGRGVKPSSIARDLSKNHLEQRLGHFSPSAAHPSQPEQVYQRRPMTSRHETVDLYAEYQREQAQLKASRAAAKLESRAGAKLAIEAAKNEARLKRSAIKLLTSGRLNKKLLYQLTSKTLQTKIKNINQRHHEERQAQSFGFCRTSWLDWLQQEAARGNRQALSALRARRKMSPAQGGNTVTGEAPNNPQPMPGIRPDTVTKQGTLIYRVGASAIRDDGTYLKVSKAISQKGLEMSLHMAMRCFGTRIRVEGTAEFKHRVVQLAATAKLPLVFDNEALEEQRRAILSATHKSEQTHDQSIGNRTPGPVRPLDRRARIDRQRYAGIERTGNGPLRQRLHKPHVARVGTKPPPQGQNRLRGLSELGMVHVAERGEMLLPSHVSGDMEQQKSHPINSVRRTPPDPGRMTVTSAEEAALKYIAEREVKRAVIKDIPKHINWQPRQGGYAEFAGWRQKDGQPLILLKSDKAEIIVLPTDAATLNRVKRLKIGARVAFDAKGKVRQKGRSL